VHRYRDHDRVGGKELVDQCVGHRQRLALLGAALLGRQCASDGERRAHVRQRLLRQIAHDYARARIASDQIVDDFARDALGVRLLARGLLVTNKMFFIVLSLGCRVKLFCTA